MHCTHLSVWILPKDRAAAALGDTARNTRAGAFLVASCHDEEFALTPNAASNMNRRIWPFTQPTQPKRKALL